MALLALLDAASAALDRAHRVSALERLIEAWRLTPHSRLSGVVNALSHDCARTLQEIDEALQGDAYQQAWHDVAMVGRSVDVPRLCAGLFRRPLGSALAERVEHLRSRPLDPRIVEAFARMVAAPPATAQSLFPMWRGIFAQLSASGAASVRPTLEGRLSAGGHRSKFWPRHLDMTREVLERLPSQDPALSAAVSARLREIEEAVRALSEQAPTDAHTLLSIDVAQRDEPAQREAQLVAQICADPSDRELRAVYVDVLAERGDPRAELIELQTRAAEGKLGRGARTRIRDLIAEHGARWLGELQPVIVPKRYGFAAGFVDWCEVWFRSNAQRELIASEHWATVRELHSDDAELIAAPTMRSLRSAGSFGLPTLAALIDGERALSLARIGPLRVAQLPPPDVHVLPRRVGALSALRSLEIVDIGNEARAPDLSWLVEHPLAAQLRELSLVPSYHAARTVRWPELLRALPALQQLELVLSANLRLVLRRAGPGYTLTVIRPASSAPHLLEHLDRWAEDHALALTPFSAAPPSALRFEQRSVQPPPPELYPLLLERLRAQQQLAPLRGIEVTVAHDSDVPPTHYDIVRLARASAQRQRRAAELRAGAAPS